MKKIVIPGLTRDHVKDEKNKKNVFRSVGMGIDLCQTYHNEKTNEFN